MRKLWLICLLLAPAVCADSVVPTRTIRAQAIIGDTDVILRTGISSGGFARLQDVVGQEARVVLYPGRAIGLDDIGAPAIVKRNQVVRLSFQSNGLNITTDGRALERGAVGDLVRIMNLSSRATLFGTVLSDGTIMVRP